MTKHSRDYAFNYLIDIIKTILLRHNISIMLKTSRVRTCRQKEWSIKGQISILNVMIL